VNLKYWLISMTQMRFQFTLPDLIYSISEDINHAMTREKEFSKSLLCQWV
jgi:hypothetical protein